MDRIYSGRLFVFLLVLLVSVIATYQAKGGLYKEGYEDGVRAAKEDIKKLDSFLNTNVLDAKPPPARMKKISDKPKSYREGFMKGYKITYRKAGTTSPTRNFYWVSRTLILLMIGGAISLGVIWALS